MIGLLLITHGVFGETLIQNVCYVLNKRPPLLFHLGLYAQDDPLDLLPAATELVNKADGGEGVLLLTDLFGASPSNLAMKLLQPGRIEGLAGVNLPMLLRALTYREKDMKTLLTRARDGGRDGILDLQDY